MIKKKFCLVGVDNDFEDFVLDNKKFYLGLFTNFKDKKFSLGKTLGKENLSDWLKVKKKFNPDLFILIDDGKQREILRKKIYQNNNKNLLLNEELISKSSLKYLSKKGGIIIQKSVLISSMVKINEGVKIHIGSQIHHGVSIDKYSTISPASVILGNVKIGKYSFVGANSTVRQNIKIGNNCVVGAGAVVVKNIKDGETVVGNPATKINYKK
jgi:acetyltransferase-like isoleucine patch superfamily enzyme